MPVYETVFASDSINRDRTKFTPGALAGVLEQGFGVGRPTLLSHDMHLPIGWNMPTAVYFEPGLTRLCGYVRMAATADEFQDMQQRFIGFYKSRLHERRPDLDRLQRLIAPAVTDTPREVIAETVSMYDPGLARRLLPKYFETDDKDSLIELTRLDRIAPGVYRAGELAVFAHHYFRRSLSPMNGLNVPFLQQFEQLPAALRPRIALDPDMIGLADTYRPIIEHEYWWGPQFKESLADIQPGVTIHGASDRERLYHGISRTEFFWYSRKGDHTLELEEIRDRETFHPTDDVYGCRYVHAIVPESSGQPVHFDGAVRLYTTAEFVERLDGRLDSVRRDTGYTKLWRIDGELRVDTWKRLLSDYYRDNRFVGEYLGAPAEARQGAMVDEKPEQEQEVKAFGGYNTGPRALIAFAPRWLVGAEHERDIVPLHTLSGVGQDDRSAHFVEAETLDVVKLMRRGGLSVHLDPSVLVAGPEDRYYNIAPIWHRDPALIPETIRCVRELATVWANDERSAKESGNTPTLPGIAVALTVRFARDETTDVIIGLRGTATELVELLAQWDSRLQPHVADASAIADQLAQLVSRWPRTMDAHSLLRFAARYGSLEFDRIVLDPAQYELHACDEGLQIEMLIDSAKFPELAAALERGALVPRGTFLFDLQCARCDGNYRDCPCVKWIDGSHTIVRKPRVLEAFVTDRPA